MKNINTLSKRKQRKSRASKGGFTLIEVLISVGLFVIVMVIATGSIFAIVGGNRKSQAINSVVNNLNFSIESMVRDMKTGYRYKCPTCDNSGNCSYPHGWPIAKDDTDICVTPTVPITAVSFFSTLSGTASPVEYKFVPPSTDQSGALVNGKIVRTGQLDPTNPASGYATVDLTASDINVTDVRFYVNNKGVGSGEQPGIFLIINAQASNGEKQISTFHIQTYVSQRILNL